MTTITCFAECKHSKDKICQRDEISLFTYYDSDDNYIGLVCDEQE